MSQLTPDLLSGKQVIVQGITGAHGSFQTKEMLNAGTKIIAGTHPTKAGEIVEGIPVYTSIAAIQAEFTVDASVVFVPAPYAKEAIFEAIDAQVPLIVVITEGIPAHDMLAIRHRLTSSHSVLLGPNSPGALLPAIHRLGIIPASLSKPGNIAIVSRSGTLTYEAMAGLTDYQVGQRYVIGIGGDQIHGIGFIDCLRLFQDDPEVDRIILIGEIGGDEELQAADYIQRHVTKPVFAYVAGHHAPEGVQLGHAGAILGSASESAIVKTAALQTAGATTATSITELIRLASQ